MFPAFSLADSYRIPVMILGDGIMGQMMEPIVKTLNPKPKIPRKPWALTGCKGRKPNVAKSFYMREGDLEAANLRSQQKYQAIQKKEERYEAIGLEDAKVILVAYGTMARITKGVVTRLRQKGKKIGLIRPITLWPFPAGIFKKLAAGRKRPTLLAVEMSYGQMVEDVRLSVEGKLPVEFLGRAGGGVPNEEEIIKKLGRLR
jgi:2-oxoglutarate ferredoxin oxidoreductase subunit alpha